MGHVNARSKDCMLIKCGRQSLKDKNWVCIEPSSEHNTEETLVRILRWAVEHIGRPWEVSLPIKSRGRKGITLAYPYFLARTKDNKQWEKVKAVFGVQGLLRDAKDQILTVPDHYVQDLNHKTFETMKTWHAGIRTGSFVRVLYGPFRMLCGTVRTKKQILLRNHRVHVHISLASRNLVLTAPIHALQNLGDVPTGLRKYYYTKKDL